MTIGRSCAGNGPDESDERRHVTANGRRAAAATASHGTSLTTTKNV